jgi:hypothetical protein
MHMTYLQMENYGTTIQIKTLIKRDYSVWTIFISFKIDSTRSLQSIAGI